MDILWKSVGDVMVLRFIGDLDAYELAKAGPRIDNLIDQGHQRLVFNLQRLTFINSSALGYLVRTKKRLVKAGGDVVLSQPARIAKKAFTILGLDEFFHVFETDDEAVAHLQPGGKASVARPSDADQLLGESSILFRPLDEQGDELFGATALVGKIASLYSKGLAIRYRVPESEADSPLHAGNLAESLHPGRRLYVKFRRPFASEADYFEAICVVASLDRQVYEDLPDEARIDIEYLKIDPKDKAALDRFVADQEGFRNELK